MSRRTRLLAAFFALAFLVFLGFIIFFADTGAMPGPIRRLYAFPYGDKAGHFVLISLFVSSLCPLSFYVKTFKWRQHHEFT